LAGDNQNYGSYMRTFQLSVKEKQSRDKLKSKEGKSSKKAIPLIRRLRIKSKEPLQLMASGTKYSEYQKEKFMSEEVGSNTTLSGLLKGSEGRITVK
jgi:hypothetical protein